MMWVIKEEDDSWKVHYQQNVLRENIISFLSDPQNVTDHSEVVYLYDNSSHVILRQYYSTTFERLWN